MTKHPYPLNDLAHRAGVTPRKVRYYVDLGLLPRPIQRGVATRYAAECLPRLAAIRRLRKERHMRLDAIKRYLAKLSPEELEALAGVAPEVDEAASRAPSRGAGSDAVLPVERWDYIVLVPGLELRLRGDASPVLRRLAQEIYANYAASAPAAPAAPATPAVRATSAAQAAEQDDDGDA